MVDQGILVKPIQKALHESVLPWLIDKMEGFLEDEEAITFNAEEVVNDAYRMSLNAHSDAISRDKRRREDMIYSAE